MAAKQRKTLGEMVVGDGVAVPVSGQPATVCPYCGCAMFIYRTTALRETVHRYVQCRNTACGKRFVTKQPVATFLREVD